MQQHHVIMNELVSTREVNPDLSKGDKGGGKGPGGPGGPWGAPVWARDLVWRCVASLPLDHEEAV